MDSVKLRTVSYTLPWDRAPLDISFVFPGEKPAGKHGFLQCKDDKFVFEDGTPGRFWGTNFNSAANFPSHEYSEIVAERLASFGLNIVRFHQLDGDWSTPNIFQFARGAHLRNTRSLDPESMDRLDYLVYALKKQGVYVYLDMLTYRRFRSGDGVENAVALRDAARPSSNFDPRLIELQKEFCTQIWTHFNPYTKLAYKDDPVFVMSEIANENEIFGFCKDLAEPYRTRLEEMYRQWRTKHGLAPAVPPVDFSPENVPEMQKFKLDLQTQYFDEMYAHIRSLGVKIPITGTNWYCGAAGTLISQKNLSFMDGHMYHYGWAWTPHEKKTINSSLLENFDPWYNALTFLRVSTKPFFVSEWDEPWPNEWRAGSVLNLAAVTAFQGWGGTTIHTYRYDCRPGVDMIAAPVTGEALSGVPYRSGVFDSFNDPAKFGLFYHAALIVRRGDVREGDLTEIPLDGFMASELSGDVDPATDHMIAAGGPETAALSGAAEVRKLGVRLPGTNGVPGARGQNASTPIVPPDTVEFVSETGELFRNRIKKIATIDSPRTKAVYGFLGAAGTVQLRGLSVRCENPFAVIALSSLSDEPLECADNILLTAVGRADNTGAKYNDNHTIQYDKGRGPVKAEVIEAEIELDTTLTGFRIDAINTHGMQVGPTPHTESNGKLRFTIGGDFPSIYYLIQKI